MAKLSRLGSSENPVGHYQLWTGTAPGFPVYPVPTADVMYRGCHDNSYSAFVINHILKQLASLHDRMVIVLCEKAGYGMRIHETAILIERVCLLSPVPASSVWKRFL